MPADQIKTALLRFQAAVKASNGPALSAALAEIETLLAAHHDQLHPQLAHFLAGRSYAKALAWLGVESAFAKPSSPPGGCGGGHA